MLSLTEWTPFAWRNDKQQIQRRCKVLLFPVTKISGATVTSKQNFIEKYHQLMKNLDDQNCSWKSEGNINKFSEFNGFFRLQPNVDLSPSEQNLQEASKLFIIKPISVTSASIPFKKLLNKEIRPSNVCVQWVFAITYFPILINFCLSILFSFNTDSFIW